MFGVYLLDPFRCFLDHGLVPVRLIPTGIAQPGRQRLPVILVQHLDMRLVRLTPELEQVSSCPEYAGHLGMHNGPRHVDCQPVHLTKMA